MVYFPKGNSRLENSHALLKRCMRKYMDMLNEQLDKCLNLAMYAFNIRPTSDNSNSPHFLVFGKEPLDAELKELEELHSYMGSNIWFEMATATERNLESTCRQLEEYQVAQS